MVAVIIIITPGENAKASSCIRYYYSNDIATVYGIRQIKSYALAPVGFTWHDNGIPVDAVIFKYNGGKVYFRVNPGRTYATGQRVYDAGMYWYKFNTRLNDGRTVHFWTIMPGKSLFYC